MRAFDLLGKRWTGVVLGTLSGGPTGFRALSRAVEGIMDSVLSDRLGELTGSFHGSNVEGASREYGTGVEALLHLHEGDAGLPFPGHHGALDRRRAAI